VRTPSGGLHLYFDGTQQRSSEITGQFLRFKATGEYVPLPPSQVETALYSGSYQLLVRAKNSGQLVWGAVRDVLESRLPEVPR
jgi:hypothetical protein